MNKKHRGLSVIITGELFLCLQGVDKIYWGD